MGLVVMGRIKDNLAVMVVAVLSLALSVASFAFSHRQPDAFDPLRLPVQTVSNRIDGIDGPAAHIGDDLHVTATKCNTSGADLGITSIVSWQSVEPGGTTIPISNNSSILLGTPACETKQFSNPMPPLVQDRTRELMARGVEVVRWRITAVVTPLGGPRSVKRAWATEDVRVVL
jgi:hypothetical protein